jgi:hypothetical protein
LDEIFRIVVPVLTVATCAIVGWVWSLWQSHNDFRLKVTEEYIRREALKEFKEDLHQVRTLVFAIARRLEIPTAHDE